MKNIAFALPNFRGGGAETVIVSLANFFSKKYNVHIVTLNNDGPNFSKVNKDIHIHNTKCKSSIKSIFKIKNMLIYEEIDVIIGTLAMAHVVALLKIIGPKNCKYIARLGNTISNDLENYNFFKKIIMTKYQRVLHFSDYIICQSKGMQKDLGKYINLKNTIVIYNPIELSKILQKSNQEQTVEFDNNYINIVSIGRLSYQKDYKTALMAFGKFHAKFHQSRYYILGEGPEIIQLKKIVNDLNLKKKVFFLGYIENPYPYLKNADMLLLTSLYEGFSNVILEAFALHTPVVATDSPGGNSEIIKNNLNGFLAPVMNTKAISLNMEKIINSNTFDFNIDKYKINNIGLKYEQLFS